MMNKAIFLDRDNTLIENDGDLGDPDLVTLIQGVPSAIASLRGLNFQIVVVTNQGGVARGVYNEESVDLVNRRINDMIENMTGAWIDKFYYCPFHPKGNLQHYRREHPWRKPQPGMLLQAAEDLQIDLSQSWMIGDQMRDIEAGIRAGTRTILLTDEMGGLHPLAQDKVRARMQGDQGEDQIAPHFVARNLIEAVRVVAQQRSPETVDKAPAQASTRTQRPQRTAPEPREDPNPPAPASRPEPQATAQAVAEKPRAPRPVEMAETREPVVPTKPVVVAPAEPKSEKKKRPEKKVEAKEEPTPVAEETETSTDKRPAPPPAEQTLREILSELRKQRSMGSDFSYQSIIAIALQIVAIFCLVAAFFLGHGKIDVFLQWLGGAIVLELACISMLLFRK